MVFLVPNSSQRSCSLSDQKDVVLIPGQLVLRFEYNVSIEDMVRTINDIINGAENVIIEYTNTDEEAKIYRPTCRITVPVGSEAEWIENFKKTPGIILVYQSTLRKYDKI